MPPAVSREPAASSSASGGGGTRSAVSFSMVTSIGRTSVAVPKNCRISTSAVQASVRIQLPSCSSGESTTSNRPSSSTSMAGENTASPNTGRPSARHSERRCERNETHLADPSVPRRR